MTVALGTGSVVVTVSRTRFAGTSGELPPKPSRCDVLNTDTADGPSLTSRVMRPAPARVSVVFTEPSVPATAAAAAVAAAAASLSSRAFPLRVPNRIRVSSMIRRSAST